MIKNISTFLLCITVIGNSLIFAQATDKKTPVKTAEKVVIPIADLSGEMKDQVSELLQQNISLSSTLNSDENRVSYLLKTANLLWQIDKTQSRAIFLSSFEDIRKMVALLDFEMNELEKIPDTEISKSVVQNQVLAKLKKLNVLTIAVAAQISGTDSKIGYDFFQELKLWIKNEQLRKNFDRSISLLQVPLLDEIAEKNLDTAIAVANSRLNQQGFFEDSIDLLQTVLKKEPKKANELARRILSSLKTSKTPRQYFSSMQKLLQIGTDNLKATQTISSNQKPIFTKSELENLSQLIDSYLYNPELKAANSPKTAANILSPREELVRAKLLEGTKVDSIQSAPKLLFQRELAKLIAPVANKKFASADKKRLIDEAMRKISLLQENQFRFEMIIWLSQKASQGGELESASQILSEAELIIKTFPKANSDFSNNWLLADAYFSVDPNKSFVMVENIFSQLNQVINAYAAFNEFLGGESFLESEEVKMESVGNAKVIGLDKIKSPLVKSLAEKDFSRTISFSNRFDRSEFRLEARVMICKAILEPSKKQTVESKPK